LLLAKVLVTGLAMFHRAGIVHCDLKPPNVQLFRDEGIVAGYRLKLIDLDAALLVDQAAPWDGDPERGYVGSPNYFSPEHLLGRVPTTASDVFTCGLMLYELLGEGHPYASDSDEAYRTAVLSWSAPAITLRGPMPEPVSNEAVANALRWALSPDPSRRPSAGDLGLILNGRPEAPPFPVAPLSDATSMRPETPFAPEPLRAVSEGPSPVAPTTPLPPPPGSMKARSLSLVAANGHTLRFGITTEIGKHLCQQFGEDARFMVTTQFMLVRSDIGEWSVRPNLDATNETILNGKGVHETTPLNDGDVLGVGRESKGILKLPLTVRLGS
jgi:eukaryotic-like serine/threonine-protein kinase